MSKSVQDKASVRKRGIKELIGGVVIAAVGGIASAASYNIAASNPRGGSYTVYTGIIALGVIYAIKGLYDIAFPSGFGKKDSADEPIEVAKDTDEKVVKEED